MKVLEKLNDLKTKLSMKWTKKSVMLSQIVWLHAFGKQNEAFKALTGAQGVKMSCVQLAHYSKEYLEWLSLSFCSILKGPGGF